MKLRSGDPKLDQRISSFINDEIIVDFSDGSLAAARGCAEIAKFRTVHSLIMPFESLMKLQIRCWSSGRYWKEEVWEESDKIVPFITLVYTVGDCVDNRRHCGGNKQSPQEDAEMEMTEVQIDRWLERGTKFFKTVSRNPVVRGALLSRGLTDEELAQGWQYYSELHGFNGKSEARAATKQTAAAQAINEVDAWDAPTYSAAHAVLDVRYPEVSQMLFENLEPTVGVAAIVGAERFLDRIELLREGKAPSVDPEKQRAAVALLATRKIIDERRATELRKLIETARLGARPEEVIEAPEMDPRRRSVAEAYMNWLHEWREVARVAIHRRDYRIALGIAQRRQNGEDAEPDVVALQPTTVAAAAAAQA